MRCVAGGIDFYCEAYGEGIPILLIHGFGVDHRAMKGTMEPVFEDRPGWKRIYIDLPGMGMTPASEKIRNTDDMLEAVVALIGVLIPSGTFLVGGTSYGTLLARGLIRRMPERIGGAMLLAPVTVFERARRDLPPKTVLVKDEKLLSELPPGVRREFELMTTVQDAGTWERYKAESVPALKMADQETLARIAHCGYRFSFDVDRLPEPFEKPVLIITGRQDTAVGFKDALALLENFPRGTYAILDRAGHSLEIEQERVLHCLVSEWLDRVEEHH